MKKILDQDNGELKSIIHNALETEQSPLKTNLEKFLGPESKFFQKLDPSRDRCSFSIKKRSE